MIESEIAEELGKVSQAHSSGLVQLEKQVYRLETHYQLISLVANFDQRTHNTTVGHAS